MPQRSADVVVIGGGVNGTSAAMNLARMGAGRVALLERGHLAGGASGRSGAMVREHYLHPALVEMAMEASAVFRNFQDAVGGDARFSRTGRVLIFPAMHREAVEANYAMNRELGVNIQALTPGELSALVPAMNVEDVDIGLYEPESGYADPVATTYAYADAARRRGAEILTETPVVSILADGGRVRGVRTAGGRNRQRFAERDGEGVRPRAYGGDDRARFYYPVRRPNAANAPALRQDGYDRRLGQNLRAAPPRGVRVGVCRLHRVRVARFGFV